MICPYNCKECIDPEYQCDGCKVTGEFLLEACEECGNLQLVLWRITLCEECECKTE
jgi:hypothetical protein